MLNPNNQLRKIDKGQRHDAMVAKILEMKVKDDVNKGFK